MGIHVVKRDPLPLWKRACIYFAAVAAALVLGGLLLLALGVDPFEYFRKMFTIGMLDARFPMKSLEGYLKVFVPLVLTSLGLSLAFKMKFWNIGGEGQFILGAIAATAVALKLGGQLPQGVVLLIMCLAAMLAAGLYGTIASLLKVKFGTNETLLTLMLNYIALYLLLFLSETKAGWNFFLDPGSTRPRPVNFGSTVSFPSLSLGDFNLNVCVLFTLFFGLLVFIYLKYTKHGYEISVVGDSVGTARYAGMKVRTIVLRTVFLSACLIGLAAAFKVGTEGSLSTAITDDVGWTGIIVAWLAQLSTPIIFLVSVLISILHYGSDIAKSTFSQVDSSFANMLQGVILFVILAADFFIRFRIVRTKKGDKHHG